MRLALVLAIVATLLPVHAPSSSARSLHPIERFLRIRGQRGASIAPDGRAVAYLDRTTGIPEAWIVPANGGWPEQLTFFGERVQGIYWSPFDRERLIVRRDIGGNERSQLFLLDPTATRVVRLTHDDGAIHGTPVWSPDGHSIAFRSNQRDPAFFDIYVLDLDTGQTRRVLEQDRMSNVGAFSPDGTRLIVGQTMGPDESCLDLLDLTTGDLSPLTPRSPPARYQGARWSADGRSIYLVTDHERDWLTLLRLDLATGEFSHLSENIAALGEHPWDVEKMDVSANGEQMAVVTNADGFSELVLIDLVAGGVVEPSPPLPAGVILDLDWMPDGSRLAITLSSARSPGTIYVYERGTGTLTAVTRPTLAGIPAEIFVEPRIVRYPSFDGRIISGLFYPPSGESGRAGPPPCLVYAHGGPTQQARPSFNVLAQYYATHGCAVFRPNVRGSAGYGRSFRRLDNVEHREDSVADLEQGVAMLVREGLIDSTRVGIYGVSYGGYMTLAALTLYPERWAAGVDRVGIANFVSFLELTGAYRRSHRQAEYGSLATDRELLERLSPLHRVDRIQAPLLVIHGANDPRVPVSEAEQIVAALRARGRPVEYLRFEDEGHGISRLENRLLAYGTMARFLADHLGFEVESPAGPGPEPSLDDGERER